MISFSLSLETTTNRQSASSSAIGILENQSKEEIENDIYYHRELLINSIEGRRVDLLTITSFHNIQKEHEHTFPDLFPDPMSKRCRKFKNKKVFCISQHWHKQFSGQLIRCSIGFRSFLYHHEFIRGKRRPHSY